MPLTLRPATADGRGSPCPPRALPLAILVMLLALGPAVADPPAVHRVAATLVWETPGETADYLLGGLLVAAARGPDGALYVADYESKDCKVFAAADGRWLRTLGREGSGPGESRDVRGLVLADDGRVGLLQIFPATLVWLDASDGTPAGRTTWREDPAGSGGFVGLPYLASSPGGWLGYVTAMSMQDGRVQERHWIAPAHPDGTFGPPLFQLDVAQPEPDARGRHDEGDYYDIWAARWAPDGQGGVWVAASRDDYRIDHHDASGAVIGSVTREYRPVDRDQLGREQALARMVRKNKGRDQVRLRPTAPVVRGLRLGAHDRLRVDLDLGGAGPEPGTITWTDVFDREGRWLHQLQVTGPFDAASDQWRWLDDHFLLVLRSTDQGEVSLRLLRVEPPGS